MKFSRSLWKTLVYEARFEALFGVVLVALVLFWRSPFHGANNLPLFLAVIHSFILVRRIGGGYAPRQRFLYTCGFSRDTVYVHGLLAAWFWGLATSIATYAVIALGPRAFVQGTLLQSPLYPLFIDSDKWLAARCGIAYVTAIPVFQFAWIRAGLAARGGSAGWLLAFACAVAALNTILINGRWNHTTMLLVSSAAIAAAIILAIAGWRLHRRVEV